jgi:parallel beta-helix repeat protein
MSATRRPLLRLGALCATTTAAVAGLGTATAQATPAPHVVYVAPSAGQAHGPGRGSCTHPDRTTVQAGVDEVSPGGTVVVCAGTYDEAVSIPKPLTLLGHHGAVLDAGSRPYGVGIGADHVTVTGLTVTGAGLDPDGHLGDGIVTVSLASGAPVLGNDARILHDVTTGNAGAGIDVNSSHSTVVAGNRSYGNGAVGINVSDDFGVPASDDAVLGNVTRDNPNGCGIALADHTGAGVTGIRVIGNWSDRNGTAGGGAGILLASPVPGAVLRNNVVSGNEASGNGHGGFELHAHQSGDDLSGNRVVFNQFGENNLLGDADDPASTGVYLGSHSPVTITVAHNRIGPDDVGIFAAGPVTLHDQGNAFVRVARPEISQPTYSG